MRAMCLKVPREPLRLSNLNCPQPEPHQLLLDVTVCGVCRTDLHIVDGELAHPKPCLIPGHEVVGRVSALGQDVRGFALGDRVGVPWLGATCGTCDYCLRGRENLCDQARFTGYTLDGGYAENLVVDARYCFHLPAEYDDQHVAPLLCAGLIGYRALRAAGDAQRLGIYGFGAAAHIITQLACHQQRNVYAFTRPHDDSAQQFARQLGCVWAGASTEAPPGSLDAAILFAPVGALVPRALQHVVKGGVVVCAGIHMSDIPRFPYALLWGERRVVSVANLTRADGDAFLKLASHVPLQTHVTPYALTDANVALNALRCGHITGAAVLTM